MAYTAYKKKEYEQSDSVNNAQQKYQQQATQKPAAYSSKWQSQLDDTISKIQNRKPFQYDVNADALYQQAVDRYVQQGKQAMMDTMGQAATMTGGYGNSYAQTVGQQTYQGYLQQAHDQLPEYYQMALDRYNTEGQDLYNQYGLMAEQEGMDYGRYQDTLANWNTDMDRAWQQYLAERDFDYGQFVDDRNYQYQVDRDAVADQQWQQNFDESVRQYDQNFTYQQNRDQIADSQWQQSFDYQKSQDQKAYEQWLQEFQYSQNRDQVADSQWQQSFDYQKSQDQLAYEQWLKNFAYQQNRDQVADSQWQQSFDYQKTQDQKAYEQWLQEFQYGQNRDQIADAQWQQSFDYQKSQDQVAQNQWQQSFDYQKTLDQKAWEQWAQEFAYGKERDQISDSQWQASFDENNRRYDQEWDYQTGQDSNAKLLEAAELMAAAGDYSLLAKYYGLTEAQVKKLAGETTNAPVVNSYVGGNTGGNSGGNASNPVQWAPGISETVDTSKTGLKASSYAMTKNNLAGLVRRGDKAGAEKYMEMIVDQLNEKQYNELTSLLG